MSKQRGAFRQLWAWAWAHPVWAGVAVATIGCLPTAFSGWLLDDWIHRAGILNRIPIHHAQLTTLFTFADAVPEHVMARTQYGYGWWTLPDLRLNFFRPVSAALHVFDERVVGPYPVLHHLHSFLWQAAGIGVSALLFRRLLAPRTATAATLLYALDESHWTASCWISNRNAWVSMVPAMLGFWAWLRAEDEDWMPGKGLAPLLFGLGLCGGETALGVAAIWVSVALWRSSLGTVGGKPVGLTVLHLLPLAFVVAVWAGYYRSHGHGASASGAYLDPGAEPLRFLTEAVHRVPALVGALVASLPVELAVASTLLSWVMAALGLICGVLVWRGLRTLTLDPRDAAAWPPLAIGGVLALFPPAAAWPSQRTLLAVSIVSAALVAMLLLGLTDAMRAGLATRAQRLSRRFLLFIHVFYAPVATLAISLLVMGRAPVMDKLATDPTLTSLAGKQVVLLAAPDPVLSFYLPALMASSNLPLPRQFNTLAITMGDVALTRTGPSRIHLEALGPPLLSTQPEQLIMDPARMPKTGADLHVPHLDVHIDRASEEGVQQVEFTFDTPLDSLTFLQWTGGRLVVVPPPVAARTVIAHEVGVMGM